MNHSFKSWITTFLAISAAFSTHPAPAASIDDCNLTWTTPSDSSFGSMPLGNGDVGANVWVEPNGDLLFYISKVDAFDAGHLLPKLGRVRLRFTPALAVTDFAQTLVLRDGAVAIRAGSVDLRVWVDANSPVIRVTGSSRSPVDVAASFETLRPCIEQDDKADRLAWGYRNESSDWIKRVQAQNTPEFVARVADPILNRTSGGKLSGPGFVRDGKSALKLTGATTVDLALKVLSSQTATMPEWFSELEKPAPSDWSAHQKWWREFWNRSFITITSCGDAPVNLDQCRFTQFPQGSLAYEGHKEIPAATNARQITQRYALERFCQAAASRGAVPPPYNGSIFTMDMPAGVMGFDKPKPHPVSPDGRDWAVLSFMWQNTRHPYWSMPARGDYDTIVPGMKFVRDGLEIGRDRCKKLLGLDGAFIMEASWWHNVGVFNWDGMPGHLRYHQLATIELPAIMAETYEHTRDAKFLKEILLPCADAGLDYYASRFTKRDARGRMLMAGVGCAETYQGVDNPCTEIGCLKNLLTKLLSFEIDDARRAKWSKLLEEMPGVPLRRIRGMDLLAVGDAYDSGREICESPELYSIYPFRQVWLGKPELLANARQSFHVRNISLDGTDDKQAVETGGWQSAPVQAAYLGLAREAARLASINFNDQFIALERQHRSQDAVAGSPPRAVPRILGMQDGRHARQRSRREFRQHAPEHAAAKRRREDLPAARVAGRLGRLFQTPRERQHHRRVRLSRRQSRVAEGHARRSARRMLSISRRRRTASARSSKSRAPTGITSSASRRCSTACRSPARRPPRGLRNTARASPASAPRRGRAASFATTSFMSTRSMAR